MTPLSYVVTPALTTPGAASQAYQSASAIDHIGGATSSFGDMLGRALDGAIATGHAADAKAVAAIEGNANITDVVTAVTKAELALQTTATIRDRMVQAYQEVMRMAI